MSQRRPPATCPWRARRTNAIRCLAKTRPDRTDIAAQHPIIHSRRRFLRIAVASASGVLYAPSLLARRTATPFAHDAIVAGEYFLIGDGARGRESLFGLTRYSPQPGRIRVWRFGQDRALEIELPFLPHAFVSHPSIPQRVVTFEKWGRHLAEIDLKAMAVVRVTQAKPGVRFFGHGAHSGQYIYATQMDDGRGRGFVAVMDAANHKLVQEIETQGVFPHDCQWLPGSGTLLVVNSRRTHVQTKNSENFSSLVWLDVATGKCKKQIFIETREFGYAHLVRSAEGVMLLAGSYDAPHGGSQPLLSTIQPDGSVRVFDLTGTSLRGEALSLYLNETDKLVAATFPGSSRIQIWNYATGKLIRQIEVGEPRGLAYSTQENKLLVSSARTKGFLTLDHHLMSSGVGTFASGFGGTGSHLFRLQL